MNHHLRHWSKGAAPAAAIALTGLLVGCGSSSSTASPSAAAESPSPSAAAATPTGPPASLSLTAHDFSFDPTTLSAPSGASVTLTFKNDGKAEHSFTPQNGLAVDKELGAGKTDTVTFTAPGPSTIKFICKYHPTQMIGTLTITAASAASGAAPPPPPAAGSSMHGGQQAAATPAY